MTARTVPPQPLSFRRLLIAMMVAIASLSLLPPAMAQFSQTYTFLKAVRDRDGTKATELLEQPGTTIINSRDISTGDTGLHIVVERRDTTWMRFLLQKGANPNIENKDGVTPLMQATNLRFIDGVEILLRNDADVNQANRSGETPLIRAVQLGNLQLVRMLLKKGADPDRVDSLAGQSARDYAKNNPRLSPVLSAIEDSDNERAGKAEKPKVFGPSIR